MKWTLEKRKISSLKPYAKNARRMDKDTACHLQMSLEKFGVCEPIVINPDGLIIGGHMRVKTLKKMEVKEVDVYVPERPLDEKEFEELNIRLNKNNGSFDFDILANEWEANDLLSWGFTLEELDIGVEVDNGNDAEESALLEPTKNPITKLGDLYELGNHRLVCGDSTHEETVKKCFGKYEPVLMVTDPPYGVNYDPEWREKSWRGATSCEKVENDNRCDWLESYKHFTGNVVYIWNSALNSKYVFDNLVDLGFDIISQIIWVKQNFTLSRGDYHWQHEICWYAVRKGCKHNWQGSRKESTVWEMASFSAFGKSKEEDERTCHSTQKPLECMSRPIKNNSAKGEVVYDPFLGSGTTIISSDRLDRICVGVELSPSYCDVIVNRYINEMKKQGKEINIKLNGENFDLQKMQS